MRGAWAGAPFTIAPAVRDWTIPGRVEKDSTALRILPLAPLWVGVFVMRILLVHCHYQNRGGEDQVFENECRLLKDAGLEVQLFTRNNAELEQMGALQAARVSIWNHRLITEFRKALAAFGPEIVHIHNWFPLLSPAVFWEAKKTGAAVVWTLHNYRLLCLNGLLFREGRPCEECLGRWRFLPGIAHGCYRGLLGSTVVAILNDLHKWMGTWHRKVDLFFAVSEFSREKFITLGLAPEKVLVKPNFLPSDPGFGHHSGRQALFVGRLSREKGVQTLLDAWAMDPGLPDLWIVGDGPLRWLVEERAGQDHRIRTLGYSNHCRVQEIQKESAFLILPSECYENFPLSLVEAFAVGLPVLASRIGAIPGIVQDGKTGRLFEAGKAEDLARLAGELSRNPEERKRLGNGGRLEFQAQYSGPINLELLLKGYQRAVKSNQKADRNRRREN